MHSLALQEKEEFITSGNWRGRRSISRLLAKPYTSIRRSRRLTVSHTSFRAPD